MSKPIPIDDRLAKDKFDSDDEKPHIIINKAACSSCDHKSCTYSCPAVRYHLDGEGNLQFDHVGCLECGNCRLVCERLRDNVLGYSWSYPPHGKGIIFRRG